MGTNMFRDMLAGISKIVGRRYGSFKKELRKARDTALKELDNSADNIGFNAVVGVTTTTRSWEKRIAC